VPEQPTGLILHVLSVVNALRYGRVVAASADDPVEAAEGLSVQGAVDVDVDVSVGEHEHEHEDDAVEEVVVAAAAAAEAMLKAHDTAEEGEASQQEQPDHAAAPQTTGMAVDVALKTSGLGCLG
jgi:hypothetical protein